MSVVRDKTPSTATAATTATTTSLSKARLERGKKLAYYKRNQEKNHITPPSSPQSPTTTTSPGEDSAERRVERHLSLELNRKLRVAKAKEQQRLRRRVLNNHQKNKLFSNSSSVDSSSVETNKSPKVSSQNDYACWTIKEDEKEGKDRNVNRRNIKKSAMLSKYKTLLKKKRLSLSPQTTAPITSSQDEMATSSVSSTSDPFDNIHTGENTCGSYQYKLNYKVPAQACTEGDNNNLSNNSLTYSSSFLSLSSSSASKPRNTINQNRFTETGYGRRGSLQSSVVDDFSQGSGGERLTKKIMQHLPHLHSNKFDDDETTAYDTNRDDDTLRTFEDFVQDAPPLQKNALIKPTLSEKFTLNPSSASSKRRRKKMHKELLCDDDSIFFTQDELHTSVRLDPTYNFFQDLEAQSKKQSNSNPMLIAAGATCCATLGAVM